MKKVLKSLFTLLIISLIVLLTIPGVKGVKIFLAYKGYIAEEKPNEKDYPVKGVDVSYYQGTVDWKKMQDKDISFAFIKATEGMDWVDPNFKKNLKAISKTDVVAGAYHYFSFGTDGKAQAENFIKNVPKKDEMLPPVVDFELTNEDTSVPRSEIKEELNELLDELEKHYGKTPIIYTTPTSYLKYMIMGYDKYTMWRRNTYLTPSLKWTFWQYDDEGVLEDCFDAGGGQAYIDLDVYNGTYDEFLKEFGLEKHFPSKSETTSKEK